MRNSRKLSALAGVPIIACGILPIATAAPASATTTLTRTCDIKGYDPGSQHTAGVRMTYTISNIYVPGAKHTVSAKWTNIGLDPRNRYNYLYLKGQVNANIVTLLGTMRTITTVPAYTTVTVKAITLRYDAITKTWVRITTNCGTFRFPRP